MIHFILALFAIALLVLGVSAARGLSDIDNILLVVGPEEPVPAGRQADAPAKPRAPASWPLAARSPTIPFYTPPVSDPTPEQA